MGERAGSEDARGGRWPSVGQPLPADAARPRAASSPTENQIENDEKLALVGAHPAPAVVLPNSGGNAKRGDAGGPQGKRCGRGAASEVRYHRHACWMSVYGRPTGRTRATRFTPRGGSRPRTRRAYREKIWKFFLIPKCGSLLSALIYTRSTCRVHASLLQRGE